MALNNDAYFDVTATGLYRAVNVAGRVATLAKQMGVSRQFVYNALQKGFLPPDRALQVEKLTGVPARELIDPKLRKIAS